jgi:hypothetical protein
MGILTMLEKLPFEAFQLLSTVVLNEMDNICTKGNYYIKTYYKSIVFTLYFKRFDAELSRGEDPQLLLATQLFQNGNNLLQPNAVDGYQ